MNKDLLIKETCTKGMRITLGDNWRESLNKCIDIVTNLGFQEIRLPIIQEYSIFEGKVGLQQDLIDYFQFNNLFWFSLEKSFIKV